MKLYFGGAYNGKLKYVKETLNIKEEDIFFCEGDTIDFSKKVICGIDKFIYYNAAKEKESLKYFKENLDKLKDKIIICDEISSGVVPLKKEERFWREETGRVLQLLTKESNYVCRIFCGLPMVLKGE